MVERCLSMTKTVVQLHLCAQNNAEIAQSVERTLPKVEVVGANLLSAYFKWKDC
nr:MAG TPA: hypothetical protein [Caudoviricetes sp.]